MYMNLQIYLCFQVHVLIISLSCRMGVDVEPGWPCKGPLLRMAKDMADRLLPAFDTPTGKMHCTVDKALI